MADHKDNLYTLSGLVAVHLERTPAAVTLRLTDGDGYSTGSELRIMLPGGGGWLREIDWTKQYTLTIRESGERGA